MARLELMFLALEVLATVLVIRSAATRIHHWWQTRRQRYGNEN